MMKAEAGHFAKRRVYRERQGSPIPKRTIRPCMSCGKPVKSEGPHHRMCNPCRNKSNDNYGVAL